MAHEPSLEMDPSPQCPSLHIDTEQSVPDVEVDESNPEHS